MPLGRFLGGLWVSLGGLACPLGGFWESFGSPGCPLGGFWDVFGISLGGLGESGRFLDDVAAVLSASRVLRERLRVTVKKKDAKMVLNLSQDWGENLRWESPMGESPQEESPMVSGSLPHVSVQHMPNGVVMC